MRRDKKNNNYKSKKQEKTKKQTTITQKYEQSLKTVKTNCSGKKKKIDRLAGGLNKY